MKSFLWEMLQTILLALLIFVAVRALAQNFRVEGMSMEPTLHNGQLLVVNKVAYFLGQPRRGDVVVFHYPKDPERDFIKRIIALPGETVEIREGRTYINGSPLDEPYILGKPIANYPVAMIRPNQYFVMGDNRSNSIDSRSFGELPREKIVGQAWLSLWPVNRWGLVPSYSYASAR